MKNLRVVLHKENLKKGSRMPTAEEFEAVTREFGLHELAVEDAVSAHQRPKLEVYDEAPGGWMKVGLDGEPWGWVHASVLESGAR